MQNDPAEAGASQSKIRNGKRQGSLPYSIGFP